MHLVRARLGTIPDRLFCRRDPDPGHLSRPAADVPQVGTSGSRCRRLDAWTYARPILTNCDASAKCANLSEGRLRRPEAGSGGRGTAMAGGRNEQVRVGSARRAIGWVPAALAVALLPALALAWPTGGRLQAGEEPNKGASSRDGAHRDEPEPPHGGVRRREIGLGPRSYWLFEPDRPRPDSAPVVVFLHGWFAVNPGFYGAWIDHLVRDGHDRDLPPVPERRRDDAAGLPAQRDGGDSRRAGGLERRAGHVRPDPGGSR